jgi:hypothetical protein
LWARIAAFFSRFSRLIAEINGAWIRHSSGVTWCLTLSHTGAVSASISAVKSPNTCSEVAAKPSAM